MSVVGKLPSFLRNIPASDRDECRLTGLPDNEQRWEDDHFAHLAKTQHRCWNFFYPAVWKIYDPAQLLQLLG